MRSVWQYDGRLSDDFLVLTPICDPANGHKLIAHLHFLTTSLIANGFVIRLFNSWICAIAF